MRRQASRDAGLILLAVLAAFGRCLGHGFVNFDDPLFLKVAAEACAKGWPVFAAFHDGNYTPLSWLLLAAQYAVAGERPLFYHLVSLLLHAVNAVFLYFIARELQPRRAALIAALLFAVHPLRAQSVAWMSEQRGLLAAFFALAAVWLRLRSRPRAGLAAFAAGLLSKSSVLPLPAGLLLLDYYPLRRKPRAGDLAAYFILSAGFAALALTAQRSAAAVWRPGGWDAPLRRAGVGLFFYTGKSLWPAGLSLYEWRWPPVASATLLGAAATLLALVLAARTPKWRAPLLSALAWQWIMLSPVLAVSLGHELAADRYSYLPGMGPALLAGAGLAGLPAAVVIGALAVSTSVQAEAWRDGTSLWRKALRVDPDSAARIGLVDALGKEGRAGEAVLCLQEHVRAHPDDAAARAMLDDVVRENGFTPEDFDDFRRRLARERAYGRETCP